MSSYDLLGLGTQALRANQSALSTIGQNISNVNTDGYSRQVTNFTTLQTGSGVEVDDIQRITDKFLTKQLWTDISTYNQTSTYTEWSSRLDNLLATDTTSLSSALDDYFNALQDVVDDPTSTPNRELFIAQAQTLTQRFNSLDINLQVQADTMNGVLDDVASKINNISSSVADLNYKIKVATASNQPTNELLDQREELVNTLSELVGINVAEQNGTELSIYLGNGQPLVVGKTASLMQSVPGDPDAALNDIQLVVGGSAVNITDQLRGGQLGGLLQYREEGLNDARDELGRIAIIFAESMNTVHQAGMDLNNEMGGLLFTDVNDTSLQYQRLLAKSDNVSTFENAKVEITDISKIKASDYTLDYENAARINLQRNEDGKQIRIDQLTQVFDIYDVQDGTYFHDQNTGVFAFETEGIKVTINTASGLFNGDQFLIQPVRTGASDLGLVVQKAEQLALASPIRISGSNNNLGTGVASAKVTDVDSLMFTATGELDPPVDVVFNNTDPMSYTLYDMTDATNPQVILANQTYTSGEEIDLQGYSVTISNSPMAGDRFSLRFNEDGISDNRNALMLSDLQEAKLNKDGAYQDMYGSLLERVGTSTASANITLAANKSVLASTQNAKASVAGVNLDEEAAKLVQFQQAYQASAQLIQASQKLFDTLISSM